jgi:hypothetical protein
VLHHFIPKTQILHRRILRSRFFFGGGHKIFRRSILRWEDSLPENSSLGTFCAGEFFARNILRQTFFARHSSPDHSVEEFFDKEYSDEELSEAKNSPAKNIPTKNVPTKNYPKRHIFLGEEWTGKECS